MLWFNHKNDCSLQSLPLILGCTAYALRLPEPALYSSTSQTEDLTPPKVHQHAPELCCVNMDQISPLPNSSSHHSQCLTDNPVDT